MEQTVIPDPEHKHHWEEGEIADITSDATITIEFCTNDDCDVLRDEIVDNHIGADTPAEIKI